jgi:transcriptional antiterminator
MTIGYIYKECMYWVSQIQSIRNELERIKEEFRLNAEEHAGAGSKKRIMEDIALLSTSLDATEVILLTSLNNGTTYWAGNNNTYDTPRIAPCENELLNRMKSIYDAHIELHRSLIRFLSAHEVE